LHSQTKVVRGGEEERKRSVTEIQRKEREKKGKLQRTGRDKKERSKERETKNEKIKPKRLSVSILGERTYEGTDNETQIFFFFFLFFFFLFFFF